MPKNILEKQIQALENKIKLFEQDLKVVKHPSNKNVIENNLLAMKARLDLMKQKIKEVKK